MCWWLSFLHGNYQIKVFDSLLNYESRNEHPTDINSSWQYALNPNLQSHLLIPHTKTIKDFPQHICCSCERFHQRKCVTKIKLSDKLSSDVWHRLITFKIIYMYLAPCTFVITLSLWSKKIFCTHVVLSMAYRI